YPQSRKLPDALLKVGYCQYELEQYPQARAALEQVVQAYPESTAARLSAQRLDRMKSEGR
ncbi:MAG: tetratricopeptide repeat protein, partial [Chromatiales bacterium]|nr:tetratricopeptide repeat protein [Chromatiales bacterium]